MKYLILILFSFNSFGYWYCENPTYNSWIDNAFTKYTRANYDTINFIIDKELYPVIDPAIRELNELLKFKPFNFTPKYFNSCKKRNKKNEICYSKSLSFNTQGIAHIIRYPFEIDIEINEIYFNNLRGKIWEGKYYFDLLGFVLIHELLHSFKLNHVSEFDRESILNPYTKPLDDLSYTIHTSILRYIQCIYNKPITKHF